jgi:hypothetical protein
MDAENGTYLKLRALEARLLSMEADIKLLMAEVKSMFPPKSEESTVLSDEVKEEIKSEVERQLKPCDGMEEK